MTDSTRPDSPTSAHLAMPRVIATAMTLLTVWSLWRLYAIVALQPLVRDAIYLNRLSGSTPLRTIAIVAAVAFQVLVTHTSVQAWRGDDSVRTLVPASLLLAAVSEVLSDVYVLAPLIGVLVAAIFVTLAYATARSTRFASAFDTDPLLARRGNRR